MEISRVLMMCSCLTSGLLCVWNDVLHLQEDKGTNLSSERLHSSEYKRQNKDCERHAARSKFALRDVQVRGVIGRHCPGMPARVAAVDRDSRRWAFRWMTKRTRASD